MARYFKIIEIDRDSFVEAVGGDFDCFQAVASADEAVYVSVDDGNKSIFSVPLYSFDGAYEETP